MEVNHRLVESALTHHTGHKHHKLTSPKTPRKGAAGKSENTQEKDDEVLEEGLAKSQSLLRCEAGTEDDYLRHFLVREEMQDELEDFEEEELRHSLLRAMMELEPEDLATVDCFISKRSQGKGLRATRFLFNPVSLIDVAKYLMNSSANKRLNDLALSYRNYQDAVKESASKIVTEELIEYSLSESAWQEVRSHRHNPSLRSIAIEKIRTYSLKHTISERYCGSCFNLQVRSLEQKESSHDRNEITRLDAGQIKEALLADYPSEAREKLLNQISMQYICDQIVSKEGGFKFQAKLATAYRISTCGKTTPSRPSCISFAPIAISSRNKL